MCSYESLRDLVCWEKNKNKFIWLKNTSLLLVKDYFFAKSRVTDSKTPEANKEKHDHFLAG